MTQKTCKNPIFSQIFTDFHSKNTTFRHFFSLETLKSAQTEIEQLQSELEQRDTAVECMMKSLDTQKSEFLARKAIYKWKDCLKERKMELFRKRLAEKHFSQVLLRKTLITWKENKNTQWRERVTLNCQSKAESMCKLLSERYSREKVIFLQI